MELRGGEGNESESRLKASERKIKVYFEIINNCKHGGKSRRPSHWRPDKGAAVTVRKNTADSHFSPELCVLRRKRNLPTTLGYSDFIFHCFPARRKSSTPVSRATLKKGASLFP